MGDMARLFLEQVCDHESLSDDYAAGFMSQDEAYDNGFIDELGVESREVQSAWDRSEFPTLENINRQIESFEGELCAERKQRNKIELNEEAKINLLNESPTCNICRKQMGKRNGKYGAFYFCKCEGQPTVSDKYWQSVRVK